jgi:hypothetical protein
VTCQYCEKPGHIAKNCFEIRGYPKRHRKPTVNLAHMTNTSSFSPPDWLFDSGASDHITNDFNNLSIKNDYTGDDHLQVANGNTLPITHIGSTTLSKSSSPPLILSNTLCVPTVTQNLVSVSQLCKTNNVSIEFFPWHFEVKELRTGEVLLRGLNEDNVYKYRPTSTIHHTSLATTANSLQL